MHAKTGYTEEVQWLRIHKVQKLKNNHRHL